MENPEESQINNTTGSEKKPDEQSGIWLESFLKISDPETGEVIVETRT